MGSLNLSSDPIPADVLAGKVREYQAVHTAYKANLMFFLMERINNAYWEKAEGRNDDLGNAWEPLSEKTVNRKANDPKASEFIAHRINNRRFVGMLSPSQRKVWEESYKRNRRNNSDRVAKEKAWKSVDRAKATNKIRQDHPANLINIRTGNLVRSTSPGRVSGNHYYPPPNQRVEYLQIGSLKIELQIPYASEVDEVRPIIPEDIREWIIYAHGKALEIATRDYLQIHKQSMSTSQYRKWYRENISSKDDFTPF